MRVASRYRLGIVLALALVLALVTGGIRVDWRGVALVAGTAAVLGLWHIATDRELGAKVSENLFGGVPVLIVACGLVVGVAVQLGRYFFPSWAVGQITGWVLACGALLGFLYMVALLCAWVFRSRWAGLPVCSIRTSNRALWFYPMMLGLNSWNLIIREFQRGSRTTSPHAPDIYLGGSMLALIVVLSIYTVVVLPFLEVRDRGLLHRGRLISWLNIERYEWESSADPGELVVFSMRRTKAVLRLHVSRLFSILPPPRIRVPAERQEELEAILKRHLSDWPQS